jgi:CheY-like chemotaxis protein
MSFAGRRVLVAEDEFLAGLTTIQVLESSGCVVVGPAARIEVALRLVQSEALDAAVLDINLAGELIWPVAEHLEHREVPFVFLSAYSQQAMIPARFASAPFLEKPMNHARFLHHLAAIWSAAG